ncbi:leucine-responsive regulatory protein Lrp [Sinorhizobium fredii USDA 257]|uniref:Leucine-responsive regulatory protein Lrp n=2 Tax=Rhizobium fredii TaxID=380 RepID=I3XB60_SINF2|nr:leucine-responsive regulatory protein Lrp [Sinorhizobium fredii USDA 257]
MRRGHGLSPKRTRLSAKLYQTLGPILAICDHFVLMGAIFCRGLSDMTQKIADEMDRRILRELITDARITNNELAERVGLSPSPCLRRLRRLEETGVIRGYTALVDPVIEGWTMTAIATVRLSRQHEDEIVMFEEAIRGWDEVLECHLVTGSRDYVLKVMSTGLEHYERFIKEKIARLKCVASIETSFVMNTIKERRI